MVGEVDDSQPIFYLILETRHSEDPSVEA